MYIIIAGGGVVGFNIASLLSVENHDVVIIEESAAAVESIQRQLDVRTITGNAATPRVLREAEAHRADLILAVTDSDETNMVVCFIAKEMGASRTAARIRNPDYSGYFQLPAKNPGATRRIVRPQNLGVDIFINPEVEMAREILSILRGFYSTPAEQFSGGAVQLREFKVEDKSLFNKKVSDIKSDIPFFIVALGHEEGGAIARADEIIHEGDSIYVVAPGDQVERLGRLFAAPKPPAQSVAVIGGGRIGYLVAEGLLRQGIRVKILERDQSRAEEIAGKLERALVLQGEPTDRDFLVEQGIASADAVVAATENDELNILATLLAKNIGVGRTLTVINKPDYIPLAEAAGIDVAGSPAVIAARKIAHYVLRGGAIAAAVIEKSTLEAIEFVVSPAARVAGKAVAEISLPPTAIIGAVVRGGRPVIPPDDSPIEPGDHVVVVSTIAGIPEVEEFFK
ncbi:Trk system potassium transporter TrkA [Dehalogenimonas alkenigignens]|uniref:Trk system potassium transporter TrkA n=1 Tax=Dehalogenimonas alkenigignens TaxID=1217799 RepID=UPI000D58115A|nr:Trk system potassium transporter TrkA [Dehalogenimonas alkenigignens]PVV83993.1 Trk system potassium transporter TrkA [Dehalogenimonas alkenigignens]